MTITDIVDKLTIGRHSDNDIVTGILHQVGGRDDPQRNGKAHRQQGQQQRVERACQSSGDASELGLAGITIGKENPIETGSYAYVPAGSLHQYKNKGYGTLRFICIVPKEGHVV